MSASGPTGKELFEEHADLGSDAGPFHLASELDATVEALPVVDSEARRRLDCRYRCRGGLAPGSNPLPPADGGADGCRVLGRAPILTFALMTRDPRGQS